MTCPQPTNDLSPKLAKSTMDRVWCTTLFTKDHCHLIPLSLDHNEDSEGDPYYKWPCIRDKHTCASLAATHEWIQYVSSNLTIYIVSESDLKQEYDLQAIITHLKREPSVLRELFSLEDSHTDERLLSSLRDVNCIVFQAANSVVNALHPVPRADSVRDRPNFALIDAVVPGASLVLRDRTAPEDLKLAMVSLYVQSALLRVCHRFMQPWRVVQGDDLGGNKIAAFARALNDSMLAQGQFARLPPVMIFLTSVFKQNRARWSQRGRPWFISTRCASIPNAGGVRVFCEN